MTLRSGIFKSALTALVLSVPAGASDRAAFKSAGRPPHLLEVYTSEGCSSCPPADLWLGELETEPNLWTDFVPVAFHVDYWNYLGWKDRLSARKYTIRQKQEAPPGKVYTPGFFLNGGEWRGWFEGDALPPADAPATGTLTVTEISPLEFVLDFRPVGVEKGPLEANAALLGMDILVPVTAGENRGKTLAHDFAVIGFRTVALKPSGGRFTATVTLRNETELDVPSHDQSLSGRTGEESIMKRYVRRLASAFWVTRPGAFSPVQAVGGFLPERK